jgi:hypothetical protein
LAGYDPAIHFEHEIGAAGSIPFMKTLGTDHLVNAGTPFGILLVGLVSGL